MDNALRQALLRGECHPDHPSQVRRLKNGTLLVRLSVESSLRPPWSEWPSNLSRATP